MKDGVRVLALSHIVFIAMLSLSGGFGGAVGEVIYYLAFLIPLIIGLYGAGRLKTAREQRAGVAESYPRYFSIGRRQLVSLFPIIAPTVSVILAVSYLTALVMGAFGIETVPVENVGFFKMILIHALIPSVTEELVFRLLPMLLVLPYSKRGCLFISALCFSLCHCDLLKFPYAFVAGIALMLVDVVSESILPSVILHFINNAVSVVWIVIPDSCRLWFIAVLAALALVSLILLFIGRSFYIRAFSSAFDRGEGLKGGKELVILVLLTFAVSVQNLF
jgi:membrane protease YdiL (CAAX protease family)